MSSKYLIRSSDDVESLLIAEQVDWELVNAIRDYVWKLETKAKYYKSFTDNFIK